MEIFFILIFKVKRFAKVGLKKSFKKLKLAKWFMSWMGGR